MKTPALHDPEEFFKLPEAGMFEEGMTPLESRDQPVGFRDKRGRYWVPILTDQGLKRKEMV